jgi:hypothetical protein
MKRVVAADFAPSLLAGGAPTSFARDGGMGRRILRGDSIARTHAAIA